MLEFVTSRVMTSRSRRGFHSNKKDWARFSEHVQTSVGLIAQSTADQATGAPSATTFVPTVAYVNSLEDLNKCVSTWMIMHAPIYFRPS